MKDILKAIAGFLQLLNNLVDPEKQVERQRLKEYKLSKKAIIYAQRAFFNLAKCRAENGHTKLKELYRKRVNIFIEKFNRMIVKD